MRNLEAVSKKHLSIFLVALSTLFFNGCATPPAVPVQQTNRLTPTTQIQGAMLDQLSIEDMRVTADLMARDLVLQPFIYAASRPPIVAVKPIENKTDLDLDPDIIQKTIRVKLMERARGKILFRDEASYQYTIDERMKQSGTIQISSTTSKQRVQQPTRVGRPLQITTQSQTQTIMREEGEVAKKVASADYFLTGFVYSAKEVFRTGDPRGMRYFQFQFRMTDAQTNIIVWEKEYPVKRLGQFK